MNDLEKDLKLLIKTEKLLKKKLKKNKNILNFLNKDISEKYNAKINVLPIRSGKNNIIEIVVKGDKYGTQNYSKKSLQKLGNGLSKRLFDEGFTGFLGNALEFDEYWRSGRNTNIGDDISLYEQGEYDKDELDRLGKQAKFNDARFYIYLNDPVGKNSKYNDCLYYCLSNILKENNPYKSPQKLKRVLNIPRFEGINIKYIPEIEKKLNIPINVSGDFMYKSSLSGLKEINLKLINGHYTIDHSFNKIAFNVSYTPRKIIMYEKDKSLIITGYDGVQEFNISNEYFDDINNFKTDYILIPKQNKKFTLKEEYENFVKLADKLKDITEGKIDLYKTGTVKRTALYLFEQLSKEIQLPENINQIEKEWLENASIGALINFTEYIGEAYKYDIKSQYPSILKSVFMIPLKSGEFKKFSQEEFDKLEYYTYGIYRVKIEKSEDENINRLFRFNNLNYYTHINITDAKKFGLKINLIEDDQANSLIYSRDKCLRADQIFKRFVDFLFKFKENKELEKDVRDYIKLIINRLWGALVETNEKRNIISKESLEDFEIPKNYKVVQIKPSRNKNQIILDIAHNDNFYKNNYARLKPFLIAKGRSVISNLMFSHKEFIKRIHTDGVISSKKLDIKLGDKLGDLVFEGYCENVIIESNVKPSQEFI